MKAATNTPKERTSTLRCLKSTGTWTAISALLLLCSAAISYRSGMLSYRLHNEAWDIAGIACAFAAMVTTLIAQIANDESDESHPPESP